MTSLKLENLGKCFSISNKRKNLIRNLLFNTKPNDTRFWALKNINFTVEKGKCVGIIGDNGSGKSTLLKVIAGIMTPSEGKIEKDGKIGSFLELGIGFQGDLSGRENIFLYGSLLGLKKEETEKVYLQIVDFSELGEAIEQPIRTYSSGMLARLAFSVISFTKCDILLFDEVLSVGDHSFKQKSLNKLMEFKREGKTILVVSHNIKELPNICDECILLEKGKIKLFETTEKVTKIYLTETNQKNKLRLLEQIKKEESENCDNKKLLYLYNELCIILDSMMTLKKEEIEKSGYGYDLNDAYEKFTELYKEKIEITKKIIDYYKKENPEMNRLITLYEDLAGLLQKLVEIYEDHPDKNIKNQQDRKVHAFREQIRFLKEAIQIGKQLGQEYRTETLYERLAYRVNEYPKTDKNEKRLLLLDIKHLLEGGLKKEKNSKKMLKILIFITDELKCASQGKKKYILLEDLKNYVRYYAKLSKENREKHRVKQIIEEQIRLIKRNPRIRIKESSNTKILRSLEKEYNEFVAKLK